MTQMTQSDMGAGVILHHLEDLDIGTTYLLTYDVQTVGGIYVGQSGAFTAWSKEMDLYLSPIDGTMQIVMDNISLKTIIPKWNMNDLNDLQPYGEVDKPNEPYYRKFEKKGRKKW